MRVLSDRELAEVWIGFFGVRSGLRVLGWVAASVIGAPANADRRWLLDHGFGVESTRYRNVAELERFRDHLRAEGLALGPDSVEPAVRAERMVGAL